MATTIKHAFTAVQGDGTDATLVKPSDWNAAHVVTMGTGTMIGRVAAGTGPAQDLPLSAYMSSILGAADANALAAALNGALFQTGDIKQRLANTLPAGWITFANFIGNAASGATNRANEDCRDLFNLIYGSISDSVFPVSGGRSGNPNNDFDAGKTMNLSAGIGRVFVSALGFTTLGAVFGEASHVLNQGELPAVGLGISGSASGNISVTSTVNNVVQGSGVVGVPVGNPAFGLNSVGISAITSNGTASLGVSGVTSPMGSGIAHNNYQPSMAVSTIIKL